MSSRVATAVGVFGIAVLVAAGLRGASPPALAAAEPAEIVFVDVAQGDAVVMRIGGQIIVSDAGEHEYQNLKDALTKVGAGKRIDVAILGHPHDDHVRNFTRLFADFDVGKAVLSRSAHWKGTDTNKAAMAAIRAEGLRPSYVRAGQTRRWGGATWQILNPPKGEFTGGKDDAPNASVAYLLTVNGVRALFTGDVEQKVSTSIATRLDARIDEPVDIFLATHHGSAHGSTPPLLAVARPRWAVLSVGPNSYKHPAPAAIDRLKATGASIWCTDTNGTITARISVAGKLTWSAKGAVKKPWWQASTRRQNGKCVKR